MSKCKTCGQDVAAKLTPNPCPWCGGPAEVVDSGWWVQCKSYRCRSIGPTVIQAHPRSSHRRLEPRREAEAGKGEASEAEISVFRGRGS